jgi:hypothetical protein
MFCDAGTSHRLEVVRLFARYLVCSKGNISGFVVAEVCSLLDMSFNTKCRLCVSAAVLADIYLCVKYLIFRME